MPLNARLLEDLFLRHAAKSLLQHAVGPGITIVIGIAQQRALLVKQSKGNPPRVEAQTHQFGATFAGRLSQSVLKLAVETEYIPM